MKITRKNAIDFNTLLVIANAVVLVCTVYVYSIKGPNAYIDDDTIWLAAMLASQTHIVLFLEKRQRDPFVILLALIVILYFSFRILTLCLFPYSIVFQRFDFNAENSNDALIFIIVANLFLYAGLYAVKIKKIAINPQNWVPHHPGQALALIAAAIVFSYSKDAIWNSDNLPRLVGYLGVFLAPTIILLMAISYYLLMRQVLSRRLMLSILVLIAIDAVLHTLTGSRSAIVAIVTNCIIVALAIKGSIKISWKASLVALVLLPLVAGLLVFSFTFASFVRANRGEEGLGGLNVERAIQLFDGMEFDASDLDGKLAPLFDRVGFFDYSAEIMAHRELYSSIINIESYGKSIIDNMLTPGFDIFDQPKISNSLRFAYEHLGSPSKLAVTESYQSDQLGLYGELYVLFGYLSLPLFFLLAYLLKRIYVGFIISSPFNLAMKRTILLYLFAMMINSFGFDWIVIDVVNFAVMIWLYKSLFRVKLSKEVLVPA